MNEKYIGKSKVSKLYSAKYDMSNFCWLANKWRLNAKKEGREFDKEQWILPTVREILKGI